MKVPVDSSHHPPYPSPAAEGCSILPGVDFQKEFAILNGREWSWLARAAAEAWRRAPMTDAYAESMVRERRHEGANLVKVDIIALMKLADNPPNLENLASCAQIGQKFELSPFDVHFQHIHGLGDPVR